MNQKLLALLALTLSAVLLSVVLLNNNTSLRTKHRRQLNATSTPADVNAQYRAYLASNAQFHGLDFDEWLEHNAEVQRQQQRREQHNQLYQQYLSSNASQLVSFSQWVENNEESQSNQLELQEEQQEHQQQNQLYQEYLNANVTVSFDEWAERREAAQRHQQHQQLFAEYLNSSAAAYLDYEDWLEQRLHNATVAASNNSQHLHEEQEFSLSDHLLNQHLAQLNLTSHQEFDLDRYLLNQYYSQLGNQSNATAAHHHHHEVDEDALRYQYYQQVLGLQGQLPLDHEGFENLEDVLVFQFLQQQQAAAAAAASNSSAAGNSSAPAAAAGSTTPAAKRRHH